MIVRAFGRHLAKNPVPDEDILAGLDWVDQMTHAVRYGETLPALAEVPDESPLELTNELGDELEEALATVD